MTSLSTEAMPASLQVELVGSSIPHPAHAQRPRRSTFAPIVPSDGAPDAIMTGELPILVGALMPTLHQKVEQDQMAVFSAAGQYERNFHTDLDKAREADFPRPIAQAMQNACSIGEWPAGLFGAGWASTGWRDSKFLAPILAGERLAIGGRVGAVDPHPAGARVAVELWVRDRSGTTTAIVKASGIALATDPLS